MDSCLKRDNRCMMLETKTPRFFKIILDSTINDGKLGIPRRFVRSYGNDLPNRVVLKVHSGENWAVELVKHGGEIWLQNGWQEFLKHFSLSQGSFLVFEFNKKKCDFNVVIFDRSATEIDYPFSIINGDDCDDQTNGEESENDTSIEILSHFSPPRKTKENPPLPISPPNKKIKLENPTGQAEAKRSNGGTSSKKQKLDEVVFVRTKPLRIGKKDKALDKAAANFRSKNPFFMIVMQLTYIHNENLYIPLRFVKKYLKKQFGDAILRTVDGKTWPVAYKNGLINGKERARMFHGWKEFSLQNRLDVGDVCVFELINRAKTTLKVTIFQHIEDASSDSDSDPSLGKRKQVKFIQRHSCSRITKDVKAANNFTSSNPFFKLNVNPSNLEHNHVRVPVRFVARFTKKSIETIMLQVQRRQWPVKLINYPSFNRSSFRKAMLSAGWASFVKANSVQVGDICIFELINSETLLLKVHIFRNCK